MLPPKPTRCQVCGRTAELAQVQFSQNIGMIVRRQWKTLKGNLCKDCIKSTFWSYSLTTLIFGWWGTISLFMAPTMLIFNTINVTKSFKLKAPGEADKLPKLTPKLLDKIEPHTREIGQRLKAGEKLDQITADLAPKIGVTQQEIKAYVTEIARVARNRQQEQQRK